MQHKFQRYAYPYFLWSLILIVFPLLVIVYFSFRKNGHSDFSGFSLESYREFFTPLYLSVLWKSLKLAIIATVICLILGYPTAWFLSRESSKRKQFLIILIMLPMWINFLLKTYAWRPILGNMGLINTILDSFGSEKIQFLYTSGAVLLGMVYNFIPFMILPILNSLDKIDYKLIEAANDLGADKKTVFFKIVLPLSIPGIKSGISLVFLPSVSTFLIPIILGGGQDLLIGNLIEQQFLKVGNWQFGSAISVMLMIIILITMLVLNYLYVDRKKRNV